MTDNFHNAVVTVGPKAPLEIHRYPTVAPGPEEVQVRVQWTSSTPLHLHQADGGLLVEPPMILGSSSAGVVVAAGREVTHLAVGDPVFGFTRQNDKEKAHQEYVTAPAWCYGKVCLRKQRDRHRRRAFYNCSSLH